MPQPLVATPDALRYAPWSFSKIETADSCPAQFHHKHLVKTAEAPKTSDTKVGTVAHGILERRVAGTPYVVAKRESLDKDPLTSDEEEMLRMLEERIEAFLVKFDAFCKRVGVKQLMVEAGWAFNVRYEKVDFWAKDAFFRGKVDLGVVTRDDDLVVIDHKSGVAKDLTRDVKKRQQLNSYAVLALPNLPGIVGVRGGIHFMQGAEDKAIQWTDYVDVTRVREVYVPWLYTRINETAATLVEPFPAKPNLRWPCEWCGFQAHCKSFQETYGSAA